MNTIVSDRKYAIRRSVTLYPDDVAALWQIGKDNGLSGISAAIRFVLADWKRRRLEDAYQAANERDKLPAPE